MTNEEVHSAVRAYFVQKQAKEPGEYDGAVDAISKAVDLLASIKDTFRSTVNDATGKEIEFYINPQCEPALKWIASAGVSTKTGNIVISISVALLYLLHHQLRGVQKVPQRRYSPTALLAMGAVAAIAHEMSHAVYHITLPTSVGKDESDDQFRALECDADRRGGFGMLAVLRSPAHFRIFRQATNICTKRAFFEAAFLGQILLCAVLAAAYSQNPRYHGPNVRWQLFSAGLMSAISRLYFAGQVRAFWAFWNAQRISRRIPLTDRKLLPAVLEIDLADQEIFDTVTAPIMGYLVETKAAEAALSRQSA
ncbi:hypothetical protein [Sinorhizobium meliloti]|uniref:hypothetical protein n=1 Tax=Rhizobium meliloti TaxID=382 RepID=UPI000FD7753F|nr:hypothetical protein [Sinorhizobium meliloti]RVG95745.1 hypothetical protein CN210_32690 [Sinorhizobium meliloti]